MTYCHCCNVYVATCLSLTEDGVQVNVCHTCRLRLDARLTMRILELEEMWKLDGSWVKEGQHANR